MTSKKMLATRLVEFEGVCRRAGVPVTVQRRVIFEELLGSDDHPTADQLFSRVVERMGGISRTTVYRVLETLVEMGLVRQVCHLGSATRFDPNTARHHHLVCTRCERVVDLDDPSLDDLPIPKNRDFEVLDYSVHYRGVCKDCCRTRSDTVKK